MKENRFVFFQNVDVDKFSILLSLVPFSHAEFFFQVDKSVTQGSKNMSKPAAAGAATPAASNQPQGTQELTAFVQSLLQQMQTRFQEMSDAIITRIDEMGARIDDLEKSIAELMQQAGVEEGDTAAAVPK